MQSSDFNYFSFHTILKRNHCFPVFFHANSSSVNAISFSPSMSDSVLNHSEQRNFLTSQIGLRNDWKHRISMKDIFLYLQLTGMVPDFQFPAELY